MSGVRATVELKCVLVGDHHVSKTHILTRFLSNVYPDFVPTVHEYSHESDVFTIDGVNVSMRFFDTAGDEVYDRLRPLCYPGTDVFMICFSVVNRQSLDAVATKWIPEVKHHCPEVPFVLVGTMIDIREEGNKDHVSKKEGLESAQNLGASAYLECSALTGEGVTETFKEAACVVLSRRNDNAIDISDHSDHEKEHNKCAIM